MPAIPLKYIILAIAVLSILGGAYFAVQSYNSAIEKAQALQQELDKTEAELQATKTTYESIVGGMAENENERVRIVERTNTIREEINAYPITTQCVESPAIEHVLRSLRDDQQRSED